MVPDGLSPSYEEVTGMCQLFDCPKGLFNLPVLCLQFKEDLLIYPHRIEGLQVLLINHVMSHVAFCVHRPKHPHKIKAFHVGM